jgi:hypothetical protein
MGAGQVIFSGSGVGGGGVGGVGLALHPLRASAEANSHARRKKSFLERPKVGAHQGTRIVEPGSSVEALRERRRATPRAGPSR